MRRATLTRSVALNVATRPIKGQTSDWGAAQPRDAPADRNESQPKIRPWVFEVAAAYRFCTSAQLTTFQNALT